MDFNLLIVQIIITFLLQGLVGAIFEGVGVSTGSFIGGYLMKTQGGSETFRLFGLMAIGCAILHGTIQKLLDRFVTERGKELVFAKQDRVNDSDGQNSVTDKNRCTNAAKIEQHKMDILLSDKEFVDISLDDTTHEKY